MSELSSHAHVGSGGWGGGEANTCLLEPQASILDTECLLLSSTAAGTLQHGAEERKDIHQI